MKKRCYFMILCALLSSCNNIKLSGTASFDGEVNICDPGGFYYNDSTDRFSVKRGRTIYRIPVSKGAQINKSLRFCFYNWSLLDISLYRQSISFDRGVTILNKKMASREDFLPHSTKSIRIQNDKISIVGKGD